MSKNNMEDWVECELGDLLKLKNGFAFKAKDYIEKGIPVLRIGDINNWTVSDENSKRVKESSLYDDYIVENGDILIAMSGATTGKFGFYHSDKKAYQNQRVGNLKLYSNTLINKSFVFYILYSLKRSIEQDAYGGAQPNISATKIEALKINLPPLPIQNAIVKKIEGLFSNLDSGIEDLKQAQDKLKLYRQAVLQKVFEGEVTNKKIKTTIIKLKEVIDKPKYGTSKKCYAEPKGIPVLRIPNINYGIISTHELKYASFTEKEISTLKLQDGDILMIRSNGSIDLVGRCSIITKQHIKYLYAGYLIRIRPNFKKINSKFLLYCFDTLFLRMQIETKAKSTSGVNNINSQEIESLKIPICSLEEQAQIVEEIEKRLYVCEELEKTIEASLEQAKLLRQSILKKAFNGDLLSEAEIQLCKEDRDYMPAKDLLEKIRREKSAGNNKPKKISADIHAGLIAKIIKMHEENPKYLKHLSHVKCEKIAHLVESDIKVPLGRNPVKDAAGPDDYPHLKKVEHRAKMAGYFHIKNMNIGHTYRSSKNSSTAIKKFESEITKEQKEQIDRLIQIFLPFDLESSEIIATLYAGWNNLLIDGKEPNDDEIVYESRENWSKRKLNIERERFYNALNWMRSDKIQIIPRGDGKKVLKHNKK